MRFFALVVIKLVVSVALFTHLWACGTAERNDADTIALSYNIPDTLKVATLYGPLSYFLYREDTLGYDYSLLKDFAQTKNVVLDIVIAPNLDKAVSMLDSNEIDLIAYNVPVISEYKDKIQPCGPEILTSQVLVQRIEKGNDLLTDVTEMVGREVWVEANSKYLHRLTNLNSELGGGIQIREIEKDTITGDDIIEMVSTGKIPMSVVDSDIALLNKDYYRNIDASLEISFAQRASWGVSADKKWLGDSITAWFTTEGVQRNNEALLKRYFEKSKNGPIFSLNSSFSKGKVSPYDNLFRQYAKTIGWDWRLVAALGYVESQFSNNLVSWAGARGLMQIMPSTARAYGVDPDSLVNPQTSIDLAVKVLKSTEKVIGRYISDPEQRRIMTIAAYNSGAAHIIDAITIAKKTGRNPELWFDNVEQALLMKSDERIYSDPDVKYGYFGGKQTTQHTRNVYDFYKRIQQYVN